MPKNLEGKTILMVDDDEEIISAMQLAFAESGAAIHTARDGNTGLDKAGKLNPDLIILDIMLPQRSGFLVLEKLQPKKQKGKRPFVIMVTGNEGKRHEAYARAMGVDEYLNKPFRLDRLIQTVEKLLGAPSGDTAPVAS